MPARNTELHVGRLVNDLAEVSFWETEGSGKPDLPPLSHCKRSRQTIVVHNTDKQELLGCSVWASVHNTEKQGLLGCSDWASGSWDFESPDRPCFLISARSCREWQACSAPAPNRERAFGFFPSFSQWALTGFLAPPWAPTPEGTEPREDIPPELGVCVFFSLLQVLCHCQEERPCRARPQRGNSQGGEARRGEAPVTTEEGGARGEPREAGWQKRQTGSGSPDGAPASHLPDEATTTGAQPPQPAWARHPGFSSPQELGTCQ